MVSVPSPPMPTARMPVLFVGHGSPMNAIEDNAWSRAWAQAAQDIPRPAAIVCVSAHWETRGVAVTAEPRPKTIHDFYGFPKPLFDMRYPAPGAPALAKRIGDLLAPRPVRQATDWGFDHGAWSVLARMYPQADIPTVQLSLDRTLDGPGHYALARRLAPLRDEGVLILGSGNVVHNLAAADFRRPEPLDWALDFDAAARRLILARDDEALARYDTLGPAAAAAINSAEHYLPLLYVLGAAGQGEPVRLFNDDVFAALSMISLRIG
jgi:4,5-DOPA dioxygenase extradiol